MFKNKEDISENTLLVLNKATALYEIFKDLDIKVNLKANDISIFSDIISKNDKKLLSIFVAIFYVDCGAKKIFEDFNIDLDSVLNLILINDYEEDYTLNPSQLTRLIFHNTKEEIDTLIEVLSKRLNKSLTYENDLTNFK